MSTLRLPLEIQDIKAILPHRYPFLLVDRIVALEEDKRVLGIKNVSANERYFIAGPGGRPTLPASILTEAMAQAGAVLILSKPENSARLVYFMGIDRVRYRRPVTPGDVVELEPDRRIVGLKNVTSNERYFIAGPGGVPTMPASILTEAMAQAGAVLILSKPENRGRLVYFMGIDRVRYRRPVVAGDRVVIECEVLRLRSKMGSLRGRALVDGKIACEGEMTFALGDRPGTA